MISAYQCGKLDAANVLRRTRNDLVDLRTYAIFDEHVRALDECIEILDGLFEIAIPK